MVTSMCAVKMKTGSFCADVNEQQSFVLNFLNLKPNVSRSVSKLVNNGKSGKIHKTVVTS